MSTLKGYKVFNPDWTCKGFQCLLDERRALRFKFETSDQGRGNEKIEYSGSSRS